MGKDKDAYNPDKERPGYGISHPSYAPVHRRSEPGDVYEKQVLSDEVILKEVGKRLAAAEALDATRLTVNVASGEVTISGAVRNETERKKVEELARNTPDVVGVENTVTIEP